MIIVQYYRNCRKSYQLPVFEGFSRCYKLTRRFWTLLFAQWTSFWVLLVWATFSTSSTSDIAIWSPEVRPASIFGRPLTAKTEEKWSYDGDFQAILENLGCWVNCKWVWGSTGPIYCFLLGCWKWENLLFGKRQQKVAQLCGCKTPKEDLECFALQLTSLRNRKRFAES